MQVAQVCCFYGALSFEQKPYVDLEGKTTCLDVLAQRKNIGVVSGDVLVDGRPLASDFARGTAYGKCDPVTFLAFSEFDLRSSGTNGCSRR